MIGGQLLLVMIEQPVRLATPGLCCLIAQVGFGQQLAVLSYQSLPQLPISRFSGGFSTGCNAQPQSMQLGWQAICLCSTEKQVPPYILHDNQLCKDPPHGLLVAGRC
jgi:hypothetical protein